MKQDVSVDRANAFKSNRCDNKVNKDASCLTWRGCKKNQSQRKGPVGDGGFAFERFKSEISEVDRSGSNRARILGLSSFAKSNNLKEIQSCPW